jgi:hypothetical protein
VTRVFSNLTELKAAVGTDLGHSAWLEIDQARHRRTLRRRTHRGLHPVRDFGRSGRLRITVARNRFHRVAPVDDQRSGIPAV